MLSTAVGIFQNDSRYTWVNKTAGFIDLAGFVTMVVLAALSLTGCAQFSHLGCMSSYLLLAAGAVGMIVLAAKNIKTPPPLQASDSF